MNALAKRERGSYFTEACPFDGVYFAQWAKQCSINTRIILEPFAGSNNLIHMLTERGYCNDYASFDLFPQHPTIKKRNTLVNFPIGYQVCITNPPYLAQNSAKRRGMQYPVDCPYDDLYKYALKKCLDAVPYVGAIIPASFLNAHLFRERLAYYILLPTRMFADTEHPVCLALFNPSMTKTKIYEGKEYLGLLQDLEKKVPQCKGETVTMRFNDRQGTLGLYAIDNTTEASISFVSGGEIDPQVISSSSRSITRISVDYRHSKKLINNLNEYLQVFRRETRDIFLTPFKGVRKDNRFRRRLDFALARRIINEVCASL
ncbi:MAG: hypothetical protein QM538_05920 [Methylacidiphilales bacterium]|nr:hypothetical protein [Candidatus Methylacidiphilales bacterium]